MTEAPRARSAASGKGRLRNRRGVPFLALEGNFVLRKGQKPDGDTISFAATRNYPKTAVRSVIPVSTAGDVTKNLRLQSLDAPEKEQPFGAGSRDALLRMLRLDPAKAGLSGEDFTAGAGPFLVKGWIATHGTDGYGRQLSYLFADDPGLRHGEIVAAADLEPILAKSVNHRLVATGDAFPAFYSNTDEGHAVMFARAADDARTRGLGVWRDDATVDGFEPTLAGTSAAGGLLIYPKFFRRVKEWPEPKRSASAFLAWLRQSSGGQKMVSGAARAELTLADLFEKVDRTTVCVPYDVTRLWFSET
jgi:endonuclease YncB( thermonuclease family)